MSRRFLRTCIMGFIAFSLIVPAIARAIVIEYELANLGGNKYRYVYTVINDGSLGAGVAVKLFDILFDVALYDEPTIAIVTPPPLNADWNEQILAALPGVAVSYDALATSGGITVGSAVKGFAVEFNWLGSGPPGPQSFEIYDPVTFALLEVGTTKLAQLPPPAAAPATSLWGLIVLGLILPLIGFIESRRKYLR